MNFISSENNKAFKLKISLYQVVQFQDIVFTMAESITKVTHGMKAVTSHVFVQILLLVSTNVLKSNYFLSRKMYIHMYDIVIYTKLFNSVG